MPGAGERYDVVVVGVQVDDAESVLAADLSALTGLAKHKVSFALRTGELIVHRSLTDEDARGAAASLQRLGAEVEVRASIEGVPDIDAAFGDHGLQLPHARGQAPIAPPPEFGSAPTSRSIDVGGARGRSPGLVDPSRPQGRPDDLATERPFAGAFERATARGRPTPHGPVDGKPEERKPREPYVGTPRRRPPEGREMSGQIADAERLAASLEAAAEADEVIEVVTLDGQSSESVEIKLGGSEPPPPPPPSASASTRASASGSSPRAAAASTQAPVEDRLALDFDPPPRAAVSGTSARVEAPPTVRSASSPGSPVPRPRTGPIPASLRPVAAAIFSSDPIANLLFAIAIGLVLGMVIAFVTVRVTVRPEVLALEQELVESASKPLQVELGELRSPEAIATDLDAKYGRSRLYFLLTMLAVGVPVGFGLARIKR